MSTKIKKIVVVGGGSAGWMSAATFATQLDKVEIVVIESPDFPVLGVGESTLGGIRHWTSLVGVKDKDFLPKVDGSYKLSIKFTDFEGTGTGGFHYPFGFSTVPIEQVKTNDWWFLKGNRPKFFDKNAYARCHYPIAAVAEQNRISTDSTGRTPGFGFEVDSQLGRGKTADMGFVIPRPVELHLGNKLRYLVYINGFSLNHVIFDERMVPMFTTLSVTANRVPDYGGSNVVNGAAGSGTTSSSTATWRNLGMQ